MQLFAEQARTRADLERLGARDPGDSGLVFASVYHDANQSIATGTTFITIDFNQERSDIGEFHSTVSQIGRFTVPEGYDGWYVALFSAAFAANNAGIRAAGILKNGTTYLHRDYEFNPDATEQTVMTCIAGPFQMVETDYIQALVFQNSGISRNIVSTDAHSPNFSLLRIA